MRPHDLLRLTPGAALIADTPPTWVGASLHRANFVVVRRAVSRAGCVPVGVRGATRDQRFAAMVRTGDIVESIAPEQLAEAARWRTTPRRMLPIFRTLDHIARVAASLSLDWGPGGSVGFELATSMPTVSDHSDLDLIVRPAARHRHEHLRTFRDAVAVAGPRVDIAIESAQGSVAMDEWLASPQRSLIKTIDGPQLGTFAW